MKCTSDLLLDFYLNSSTGPLAVDQRSFGKTADSCVFDYFVCIFIAALLDKSFVIIVAFVCYIK